MSANSVQVEMMKAVSFMYVRPPGYNAESAKAAEIADERKKLDHVSASQDPQNDLHTVMYDNDLFVYLLCSSKCQSSF